MGSKPSHALPANRPESGGTIQDRAIETSGLLEREKNEFAAQQQKKRGATPEQIAKGDQGEDQPSETGRINE